LEGIDRNVPLDQIQLIDKENLIKSSKVKLSKKEEHLQELHKQRKGTKQISLYDKSQSIAKTKSKRTIKKPSKLDL
jgi:hypothetical protein